MKSSKVARAEARQGPRRVAVLGPQRHRQTVSAALEILGVQGGAPIATVTAGWEERETEDQELHEHLWSLSCNLRLFERSEQAQAADPELRAGIRWRNERLRELQELYRVRMRPALEAARELFRREPSRSGADLLAAERAGAIDTLRSIDGNHQERVGEVRAEFEQRWAPASRAAVARQRKELQQRLGDCAAVCVAGGHVAILLDVLRLFDFPSLLGDRPLVCWSAGAMALSERIVLFHDSPPQGPSSAEVLEAGLGLVRGLLPLPHARHRLRLTDPLRVAIFALRFRPLTCVPLDDDCQMIWDGEHWRAPKGTHKLSEEGAVVEVGT